MRQFQVMAFSEAIADYVPLVGEVAWHSVTVDPSIAKVSQSHFEELQAVLKNHWRDAAPPRCVLEVACYAHTTGYRIQKAWKSEVTLFDISARALRLGRRLQDSAPENSPEAGPRLVAGDFHDLPFDDGAFDVVFMHSALHHTWRWQAVLSELRRVLAPGGLLFLGNEPIRRACCFYKFRTNRPEEFTPFERCLQDKGIIRTVAEPYLGSRPESLFGMVENQTIPLGELMVELRRDCRVVETRLTPESCMSRLDHSWLHQAGMGVSKLARIIGEDLQEGCAAAFQAHDASSRGMDFSVPSGEEIEVLARETALLLGALPEASDDLTYRMGLAEIFGAATAFVARKRGRSLGPAQGFFKGAGRSASPVGWWRRLSGEESEVRVSTAPPPRSEDGLYWAFPQNLSALMQDRRSQIADLQESDDERIQVDFPALAWRIDRIEGIVSLTPTCFKAAIQLRQSSADRLLVLRFHGAPEEGKGFEVRIEREGNVLYAHHLWQRESFLCALRLKPDRDNAVLEVMAGERAGHKGSRVQAFNVSYAGLFELPSSGGAD